MIGQGWLMHLPVLLTNPCSLLGLSVQSDVQKWKLVLKFIILNSLYSNYQQILIAQSRRWIWCASPLSLFAILPFCKPGRAAPPSLPPCSTQCFCEVGKLLILVENNCILVENIFSWKQEAGFPFPFQFALTDINMLMKLRDKPVHAVAP